MKNRYRKIAITTGDISGIGLEVAAKALSKIQPSIKKNNAVFLLFRHHSQSNLQPKYFKLIDKKWQRVVVSTLMDAFSYLENHQPLPDNLLLDISQTTDEGEWILEAAQACAAKKLTSMVTGPISKGVTARLPSSPIGHTGIFRQLFPNANLHMGFVGKFFNVLLSTDHISIASAEARLAGGDLDLALKSAKLFRKLLKDNRKIGVLGLNPHSGENGLLGDFEKKHLAKLSPLFVGPLVPDAAFLKKNWSAFSLYLCLYHDQGLIPFKMQHGQDFGVHITVGLPFIRTSVDHGTAEDIYNKNIANSASMLEAIQLNLRLAGV